jgi:hypothetical protein
MHKKYLSVIVIAVLLIGITALLFIFKGTTSQNVLVIVGQSGGNCASGLCGSSSKLYKDGTYENHEPVSVTDMSKILDYVDRFDESKYTFSNDCGTSIMDGSDTTFTFPNKYDDRTFESCQQVIQGSLRETNVLKEMDEILTKYE